MAVSQEKPAGHSLQSTPSSELIRPGKHGCNMKELAMSRQDDNELPLGGHLLFSHKQLTDVLFLNRAGRQPVLSG